MKEIVVRGRQAAMKMCERKLGRHSLLTNGSPSGRVMTPESFWENAPARFFSGVTSEELPRLIARYSPDFSLRVKAAADRISDHSFDLLGYERLSFGEPPDWHLDPVARVRAPLVHWSLIDPLDFNQCGDSKVIWELNRHQWMVTLALAHRVTGDERYARRLAEDLRHWIEENPPGVGINWASSLEVALRLISWCWVLMLLSGSSSLTPELFVRMLHLIHRHATHAERYLSYYFSPNTHLTAEALGLLYAGVVFSEFKRASRWRALGAKILVAESRRQILGDGVYFEQSTCYQRYTAEIYLHFLILAGRNGVAVPPEVEQRVQRLLDFLLAVRRPDGTVPQIGDADGGTLLPLLRRTPGDDRGVFSTAAALFGRAEYSWAAGELSVETLFLLGTTGVSALEALRPSPPSRSPSCVFPEGGYVIMRDGWSAEANQLTFDVGPLGCPVTGGHGHADLLSVQCSAFGQPLLVDAGTYCYTPEPEWRDFFRGGQAHSTITVDGRNQADPAAPFAWSARPTARLRRWRSTGDFDLADAEHEAYHRLPDPVTHRRRVLFKKTRWWIIVDDLVGKAEHRIELRYQLAPLTVGLDLSSWVRAEGRDGRGIFLRAFAAAPLKTELFEGCLEPIQGWVSENYGRRRPAPVVVYSTVTRLPTRIITLLVPASDCSRPAPRVVAELALGGKLSGLAFEDEGVIVRFADDGVEITDPSGSLVSLD